MSTPKSALPFWSLCGLGLAGAAIAAACTADPGNNGFSTQGGGANGSGGPGATGAGTGGDNLGFGGSKTSSGQGGGFDPDGGCAGEATTAQQLPLDMYIMLDQSGSMKQQVQGGGTKWTAVTSALQAFVSQPGLGGISVGIQYFGQPVGGGQMCNAGNCTKDSDCGAPACGPCQAIIPGVVGVCLGGIGMGGNDSCNAADYTTPEVEIAPLPGVAGAIITSMMGHSPSTSTPTQPALQGAIDHVHAWAQAHPGHVSVAVLATDGAPSECPVQDGPGLAAIAAAGLAGNPSVKTFTIGIFAPADIPSGPTVLNDISAGGGTGMSFTIDTQNMNVNQQFLAALNAIRGSVLACTYSIPAPSMGTLDYSKVNVEYTPGGGGPTEDIPKYQDKAHCPASGDGWYYDNDNAPTQIILCDATCNKVSADATGTVNIVLGCQSKMPG